ncbi:hypothetical protein [Pantoea coffeiphila]|uniref:hypothetical protein n=1 Tax=Pantoea coffeiphila TaxID=1465635 RepID=UPI00195F3A62|nr:hypothetical protein [Pantoea coffeiphila]MBM7345513.1 hypothetical protein [Pantoea coffeiphila]
MIGRAIAIIVTFSSTCFASPILTDAEQVNVKLNDGTVATVKTCEDFISIREKGKEVVDYPNLPDRFVQDVADSLVDCYLQEHASRNKFKKIDESKVNFSIKDIVEHFPASESVIVSKDEEEEIKVNDKGKSISEREQDLNFISEKRAVSDKNDDGYFLSRQVSFEDGSGRRINYITLVKYVIGGTWASANTYEILSTNSTIWQLKEITVNSPL